MVCRSVVLCKGVKVGIGVYRLWVIEVVVFNRFYVDVVSLQCVEMCSFFVVI